MNTFKKTLTALTGVLVIFLLFAGCDEIDPPYMTGQENNGNNGEDVRKVLLEEYTGHLCPNCPEASKTAKNLSDFFGDQLVIMSIHAGYFARVTDPPFDYDFTTTEGEELYNHFNVSSNPIGTVNRTPYDGSTLLSPAAWGDAINIFAGLEPHFNLDLSVQHRDGSKEINVEANVHVLKDSDNNYALSAFIIENNIIKPQRINDPDYPDGIIKDYEHNHVLRKGINGTWGESINEEAIETGELISKSYTAELDDEWVAENCGVIAFVYDESTNEILQVEETPLKQ